MTDQFDTFAISTRNFDSPVSDRFAERDRIRRAELDAQCRAWREANKTGRPRSRKFRESFTREMHVYFEADVLRAMRAEARRRGLTLSMLVREVWEQARETIRRMPAAQVQP